MTDGLGRLTRAKQQVGVDLHPAARPSPQVFERNFEFAPFRAHVLLAALPGSGVSVEETELSTVRRVHLRVVWDERNPNACELVYYIRDRREPDNV